MISLIICTYNREKYIGEMLECVAANHFPRKRFEIILVDNNSTDSTKAICEAFSQKHKDLDFKYFLENKQGLSYARNRGIREANGDVIVFLDDDAFVEDHYLQNLETKLNEYPDAAAFGGRIDPLFESGKAPDWLCKWNLSWVSAIDKGNSVCLFKDKYPIGANMGFRKSTLDKCGLFSTQLGRRGKNLMGGEEKDLFLRVSRAGFNIYYFPDVRVQHVIPESRTTKSYIIKFAQGIGMSEYVRCNAEGGSSLIKRRFAEIVKWGASIILWIKYLLIGRPACGNSLLLFRWHVSRSLFTNSQTTASSGQLSSRP